MYLSILSNPSPSRQLVIDLLTCFYNSKNSYLTIQPTRLEGKEDPSSFFLPLSRYNISRLL